MSLLWGTCYDPAAQASKSTATTLAMTALDTSFLRATFNAPANGSVLVRMQGVLYGAATYPQILFGVLSGSTVMGRVAPTGMLQGVAAATTGLTVEGLFVVTGLTPAAAQTWDAAYSVDSVVAATNIKYGGANDTVSANAWGGFCYEIWST